MGITGSTRAFGAALLLGLVGAATAGVAPAGAATVAATGATITRTDAAAGTTLTVKATVPRLDLWCASNKLVVNKKATAIPCNRLLSVTTTGLTGNDTVVINATGFGSALPKTTLVIKTGAGNDTISVRHHGALTVWAGAGNDKVEAGLGAGKAPVSELLQGEDGNDSLRNLGFIAMPRVVATGPGDTAAKALRSSLVGGPGTDTLIADGQRWTDLSIAAGDTVTWAGGPATFRPEVAAGTAAPWTYDAVGAADTTVKEVLTYGTATALQVGCVTSAEGLGRTTVNGLTLPLGCSQQVLSIVGTDRAETLTYDQAVGGNREGVDIRADLRGGDDTATVRSPFGAVSVLGGAGNDRLTVGSYNRRPNDGWFTAANLAGGPGNDTLTNLGFLDPNPPLFDEGLFESDPHLPTVPYPFTHTLDGGPGADRISGATTTWEEFAIDPADTVTDPGGPARIRLTTGDGADTIRVRNNGTAASAITTTTPSTGTKTLAVPLFTDDISIDSQGGDDQITVENWSKRTQVTVAGGTGYDRISVRPRDASWYSVNADPWQIVWQPPVTRAITFNTATFEAVSIAPLP